MDKITLNLNGSNGKTDGGRVHLNSDTQSFSIKPYQEEPPSPEGFPWPVALIAVGAIGGIFILSKGEGEK